MAGAYARGTGHGPHEHRSRHVRCDSARRNRGDATVRPTGKIYGANLVGRIHVTRDRDAYFAATGGVTLQPNGQPGDTIGPLAAARGGQVWDCGRNSIFGPGFSETYVNLKKSFHDKQEVAFELRASISNVFNRVNLVNPLPYVDCGGGGAIFGAVGHQRDVQFLFRLQV